ncbi:uncharacterized protein PHALS_02352 [Plasmopara halstedii]|uniref:RxLR-like protein n=1 Tax=Plasmopara halstedii TaxID=4781 RepID=A0A0P1AWB6_PLAHL|nr:uncharacterized protein PHALS_02352 [Plasmopara halstedii]CEG46025.1 hypothetical protein PHALS_02352 [Plasmopara halstedii]|eukprot:XP_024582394.1 hypothetical protein PHALS_02352 [Plasmopara halstedii]
MLGVLLLVLMAVALLVAFVAATWEHDLVQSYDVLPAPADLGTKEFYWRCWLSSLTRRGWRTSILRNPCPRITLQCPFVLMTSDFAKLATSLSLPKLALEQVPFMFPQMAIGSLFLQLLGNSHFPVSVRQLRLKAVVVVQLRPLDMSAPSQNEKTPPPSELKCLMVLTGKRFLQSEIEFTVQTDLFDSHGTSSFSMDQNVVSRASANLVEDSFECSTHNATDFSDVSVVDVTGVHTSKVNAAPLIWILARAASMLQQQNRVPAQPLMCSCMIDEKLSSVPLNQKLVLQSWTAEEYQNQQTQPEISRFAVSTQGRGVLTGILRTVGWNFSERPNNS